ncbi:bacteriocin [Pontibacter sp. MBLB2868]|uniref:bacteriocin n=1 Tax=Pontibacter sp. MBLB2868 TaxID=3451555 RepID=UPI003F755CA3
MNILSKNELKAIKGGLYELAEEGTCRWWVKDSDGTKYYSPSTMYKDEAIGMANDIGSGAGWCCDSCPY